MDHASPPTITDLQDPERFTLLESLGHQELLTFVAEYYWRRKSPLTWVHYLFSAGTVVAWFASGLQARLTFDGWMTQTGYAILLFFLLLPLHEGIHGLGYTLAGARDVQYGVNLRQFYAYAIAHNFVAIRKVFLWVASLPFLLITLGLLAAILALPQFSFILLGALVTHTAGTSGDLAFVNYYWLNRRLEIYTYDDAGLARTYLFARRVSAS